MSIYTCHYTLKYESTQILLSQPNYWAQMSNPSFQNCKIRMRDKVQGSLLEDEVDVGAIMCGNIQGGLWTHMM